MDSQQIGLCLALDTLERDFCLITFDDRLVFQKTVYLAEAAGVDLGYHFHWYLRGPYSPSLTRDAFTVAKEAVEKEPGWRNWRLDKSSKQRLDAIRPMFEVSSTEQLAKKLERLASIHYLTIRRNIRNVDDLEDLLETYRKHYPRKEIEEGLEELRKYDVLEGADK